MYRLIASLLLVAATLGGTYLLGRSHESAEWEVKIAQEKEASREVKAKLEADRLAKQAQIESLQQSLEDEAYNAPITSPACLSVDRVRGLNKIR